MTSVVLARGAAEVRAHRVAGAEPGTPVRVTGWAAEEDGVRAELVPVAGLDDSLTGVTGDGDSLFVALARLTGETNPVPLEELVSVRTEDGIVHVSWSGEPEVRVHLSSDGVRVTGAAATDG